ncbi:hypothetical protein PF006_g17868, partial [Phytophthora fragariae]
MGRFICYDIARQYIMDSMPSFLNVEVAACSVVPRPGLKLTPNSTASDAGLALDSAPPLKTSPASDPVDPSTMSKGPFLTGEDCKSAFNLFCCIYGIGTLGMPGNFARAGPAIA